MLDRQLEEEVLLRQIGPLWVVSGSHSRNANSVVVVAVYLTWAIHLIIRLLLSHQLRTDSAERVGMTQTYLALLEEAKLSEEKDRSLIVGALFAPASDGKVKAETIPHLMLDALTKVGGKGS